MTQSEVRKVLGEPKNVFPGRARAAKSLIPTLSTNDGYLPERLVMLGGLAAETLLNPTEDYYEGWEYPPKFTRSYSPSYYVYFDQDKKVIRLSEPSDPDRTALVDRDNTKANTASQGTLEDSRP